MSGILHSILAGRTDGTCVSLTRQANDVSKVIAESPSAPYLRFLGGGIAPIIEPTGINIANTTPGLTAQFEIVYDTPHGTFRVNGGSLLGGGETMIGGIPPLAQGQTARVVMLSTSDPGASIDVITSYSDADCLAYIEHELQSDWADVLVPEPSEVINQLATQFAVLGITAVEYDLRVVDDEGAAFVISEGDTGDAGEYEFEGDAPVFLRPGERLQARAVTGTGFLTLFPIRANDFFGGES